MVVLLWLLSAFLVALAIWILFVPVAIIIDTSCGKYRVVQMGTFSMSFHPQEEPRLRMRVFGIRIAPNDKRSAVEGNGVSGKKRKVLKRRPLDAWLYLFKRLSRAVKVRNLTAVFDLDDVVLNAQLVPILMVASHGPVRLSVNFQRRNYLRMIVQLRLHIVLWTYIRFFIKY